MYVVNETAFSFYYIKDLLYWTDTRQKPHSLYRPNDGQNCVKNGVRVYWRYSSSKIQNLTLNNSYCVTNRTLNK